MSAIHSSSAPGYFVGGGANVLESNRSLPFSQYEGGRNLMSTRYIEFGIDFPSTDILEPAEKVSRTVDISNITRDWYYDRSITYRYATFGLDSFIITRDFTTFNEANREPLAIDVPQLSAETQSRYSFLLAVDQNILPSSSTIIIPGELPPRFTVNFGILNASDVNDGVLYAPNTTRSAAPLLQSQKLKNVLVRFYVKAVFEPNFISYLGVREASMAAAISLQTPTSRNSAPRLLSAHRSRQRWGLTLWKAPHSKPRNHSNRLTVGRRSLTRRWRILKRVIRIWR